MRIMIPRIVKVGFKKYVNMFVPEVKDLEDNNKELYGEVQYYNEIIKISTKYPETTQEVTFIHELLHAIDDMYFIGLTEQQVRMLANGLYMVIDDNNMSLNTTNMVVTRVEAVTTVNPFNPPVPMPMPMPKQPLKNEEADIII